MSSILISQIKIKNRHRKDLGDIAALAKSIEIVGLLQPVVLTPEYRLIAGERRIKAFKLLGKKEIPAVIARNLKDALALLRAERDENTCRKDFMPEEAVAVGEDLLPLEEKAAKERADEGRKRGGKTAGKGRPKSDSSGETFPQAKEESDRTRDRVAEAVGMSGRTYEKAKAVVDAAKEEPEKYQPFLDSMNATGKVDRAFKDLQREKATQQNKDLVAQAPQLVESTDGQKFPTIVIDPPWDWDDEGDQSQFGRGRPVYATMPIEEIAALPVAQLAQANSHLYLWITNRSLPKGFALLEAWGFRYVTCLTWCKPNIGMGNYFRGSTEHVLFGVRGSLGLLQKNIGTWFQAERGDQHSDKPGEFFELVEKCSPGPWLEMFSRRQRGGWAQWGAEM